MILVANATVGVITETNAEKALEVTFIKPWYHFMVLLFHGTSRFLASYALSNICLFHVLIVLSIIHDSAFHNTALFKLFYYITAGDIVHEN